MCAVPSDKVIHAMHGSNSKVDGIAQRPLWNGKPFDIYFIQSGDILIYVQQWKLLDCQQTFLRRLRVTVRGFLNNRFGDKN